MKLSNFYFISGIVITILLIIIIITKGFEGIYILIVFAIGLLFSNASSERKIENYTKEISEKTPKEKK